MANSMALAQTSGAALHHEANTSTHDTALVHLLTVNCLLSLSSRASCHDMYSEWQNVEQL